MRKSQHELVLEHLKEHGSITSLEGQRLYGIMQMPRRIWNLKAAGYDIESVLKQGTNRRGDVVTYALYIYHGKKGGACR